MGVSRASIDKRINLLEQQKGVWVQRLFLLEFVDSNRQPVSMMGYCLPGPDKPIHSADGESAVDFEKRAIHHFQLE